MRIKQKELIEILGIGPSSLKNWVREGMPKAGRGIFDLGPVIKWVRENKPIRGAEGSLTFERTRMVKAQARLKELDLLIREGALIPRNSVLKEFLARIAHCRQGLLILPRTLPGKLSGKDPRAMGAVIKKSVYNLLDKFSEKRGALK
jgi:phage terminase Nu1 subunit (DNA packaging protein)